MLFILLGTVIFMLGAPLQADTPVQVGSDSAIQSDQRAEIDAFLSRFVTAFENLDMSSFIECFREDATVFFPEPYPPGRFDGRSAIERQFRLVFEGIRAQARSGPPYHRLHPADLNLQMLGPGAAVVTFHLRESGSLARRTLVLSKGRKGWQISHLHASTKVLTPKAPQEG